MPKMPKKPTQRVRFTCDADEMSMTELDKIIVQDGYASVDKLLQETSSEIEIPLICHVKNPSLAR